MDSLGFITDDLFLEHRPPAGHPERPERLEGLVMHLRESELWRQARHISARPAEIEDLLRVHSEAQIRAVERVCAGGGGLLDEGDTFASERSFDAALLAAGAVVTGIEAVAENKCYSVFCAVRPPGHHAERDRPMGFCLFNNVAIGARYARDRIGYDRVAILDWDVHHGNGTQHAFEEDPTVLFISLHQFPFYPGTGARSERGRGRGEGSTVNIPLAAGSGEQEYLNAFETEVLPTLREFSPGLLLISAGFDAHRDDPLAGMMLEESSYGRFTSRLSGIAPMVSVLEGGYSIPAVARSVEAHLAELQKMAF